MERIIYTAVVASKGGRDGHIHSSDGILDGELAIVDGLGQTSGKQQGTNPEQLFAGGYAACFESTILGIAQSKGIAIKESSVRGNVNLIKGSDGLHLSVKLQVSLPGIERETANMLIALAHEACPYSKAVKGNIQVEIVLDELD